MEIGIKKVLFFHFSQIEMAMIIFTKCGYKKWRETGFFSPFYGSPSQMISVEPVLILGFGVIKRSYFLFYWVGIHSENKWWNCC